MELEFELKTDDYLKFQLYSASKSVMKIEKRKQDYILVSFFMMFMTILFWIAEMKYLCYYFLFITILTIIFYPKYSKFKHRNHYKNHIEEIYKNKVNKVSKLIIGESNIEIQDSISSGKISITGIENIANIGSHIFAKLKSGESIIFPKSEINEWTRLIEFLKELCNKNEIDYITELDWKW